jgi:hypothetical protein
VRDPCLVRDIRNPGPHVPIPLEHPPRRGHQRRPVPRRVGPPRPPQRAPRIRHLRSITRS